MPYNKIYSKEQWDRVIKENKNIIDDYIMELKSQKKSEGTIKQYFNDLRIVAIYVLENCNNRPFTELGRKDFRRLVLWLTDDLNVSNARANRMMSSVRTLLSYLEDDDDYEDYQINQAAKIKGLRKEEVRDIVFISDEDILKLYDKLMNEERYKEATLLGLLYDSGCRKNEIKQVRRDDIKENGNATHEVVGKRGKKFPVLYFRLTKEAFAKYNEQRGEDNCEALFITGKGETAREASVNTLYDWVVGWRDDLKEITGKEYKLNVHTFRHCFIENFVEGTHYNCRELNLGAVPIEKVKLLAHHSDVSTTDKYRSNDENRDIENFLGIKLKE